LGQKLRPNFALFDTYKIKGMGEMVSELINNVSYRSDGRPLHGLPGEEDISGKI